MPQITFRSPVIGPRFAGEGTEPLTAADGSLPDRPRERQLSPGVLQKRQPGARLPAIVTRTRVPHMTHRTRVKRDTSEYWLCGTLMQQ
jgi:hypothetical protein